jgi:membrane protein YdbS with pleckstrin-like domain
MWAARQLLLGALAVVVLAVVVPLVAVAEDSTGAVGTAVALLGITGLTWSVLRGRYQAWGYAERAEDLLVHRGLLVRRLSVVPYGRMQFVDVTAGPIDRLFGIATLQLHTAAAATDARIPGLARDEAQRLRDRLAALGEARAAGL